MNWNNITSRENVEEAIDAQMTGAILALVLGGIAIGLLIVASKAVVPHLDSKVTGE